ncbi:3431_t:CDS:1, partial [Racocetra persica]
MALSTWSAPVAEDGAGGLVENKPHKRDTSPELSGAFHLMAELKAKREVNEEPSKREVNEEPSKRETEGPHLSKRALIYRGGV